MINFIKQKYLAWKYKRAKEVYLVCLWQRYAAVPYKWTGKYTKDREPLIIDINDHNGEKEEYVVKPISQASTYSVKWFFSEKEARNWCKVQNEKTIGW